MPSAKGFSARQNFNNSKMNHEQLVADVKRARENSEREIARRNQEAQQALAAIKQQNQQAEAKIAEMQRAFEMQINENKKMRAQAEAKLRQVQANQKQRPASASGSQRGELNAWDAKSKLKINSNWTYLYL